ncbi:MAG TPA: hypothetical protein DD827_07735 [Gammaproteobacteria bacterium]|jgi:hypothetical protein|nr:hypothetical protein [Gammaproteobacteria bacterium]
MNYKPSVKELDPHKGFLAEADAFIVAAGFEDRSKHILVEGKFAPGCFCILIKFKNDIAINKPTGQSYELLARKKFGPNYRSIDLEYNEAEQFQIGLKERLLSLPKSVSKIAIDVSGLPTYAVFAVLNAVREVRPYDTHFVLYTSAISYLPSELEYQTLVENSGSEIDYLPKAMALEMDENLNFEPFRGYRTGGGNSCLALFAGYEAHRSTGVIEEINPTMLLLIYGEPPGPEKAWRLDMAQRLHRKFETTRRCAIETVSTLEVEESLDLLENYYEYLIDDYDLTISPVCSKMQSLAAFLFWERYPEVQITFPLPIGYDPERRPTGISTAYYTRLPPRLSFAKA